jgi:hypothetical protein
MNLDLDEVISRPGIDFDSRSGPEFAQMLADLRILAESGHIEAAQELADQLALPGPHHDPVAAYKWYYISLTRQGYTAWWEDHNHTPPYYCGPVGDFRNESMVSDLVLELGWERVWQLDKEAAQWMAERNLTSGCS